MLIHYWIKTQNHLKINQMIEINQMIGYEQLTKVSHLPLSKR